MQSGRQTLTSIDQGIGVIYAEMQKIDEQSKMETDKLIELQQQQANRYKQMAKIRLDNVISGELVAGLNAVDQRVSELLKERHKALDALHTQLKENLQKINELNIQREKLDDEVTQVMEAIDNAEALSQQRLNEDANYQLQLKKTQEAERTAEHAEEKTKQAETMRAQKGQPYESDRLFMYLWKRNFGTSNYSQNVLARLLDKWVARLCKFNDARANYAMLLEIPKRLLEHAQQVRMIADQAFEKLTQMEMQAAEEGGMSKLKTSLEKIQSRIEKIDAKIEEAQNQSHVFERQQAEFSSGEDEHFKQAINLLSNAFEQENLRTLYEYARITTTAEDDVLVAEIDRVNKLIQQVRETISENKVLRERNLDRLKELENVRRRFKQQRYDSSHSGFNNADMITMILGQFLRGMANSGDLWRTIEREQTYTRPRSNPDFGSGGFGGRQSTWHFPFPSGRDMGGLGGKMGRGNNGGFRTGGGF